LEPSDLQRLSPTVAKNRSTEDELAETVTTPVRSARRYSDSPAPIARSRPPDAPTAVASSRGVSSPDGSPTVTLEADDVYQVAVRLVSVLGDGAEQLAGTDVGVPPAGEGLLFDGADVRAEVELEDD